MSGAVSLAWLHGQLITRGDVQDLPALQTVDDDTAMIFAELTELGLGSAPAAQIWRDLMSVDLSFFRSETSERLRSEGRAEGRAEDILRILSKRGVAVSEQVRERIVSCADLDVLSDWLDRSLTAEVAEDLFVAAQT